MILSEARRDAIQELFNIGVGHAASTLNDFVQQPVGLQVPEVYLSKDRKEAIHWIQHSLNNQNLAIVQMGFDGDIEGSASLAFSHRSAHVLASMLGDGDDTKKNSELDSIGESVLIEVGNVLMNGVMGTLGNMLKVGVQYQVPQFLHHGIEGMIIDGKTSFLMARTKMTLAQMEMEGVIIVLFAMQSHDTFLEAVDACLVAANDD